MAVPASLYLLQNNLQFHAAGYLNASTYQVMNQLKVLTTAIFSVVILGQKLSTRQWMSLFLLSAGLIIVQLPSSAMPSSNPPADGDRTGPDRPVDPMGLLSMAFACILSGLSGVYFEKVLKGTTVSLWARNIQLSAFSITVGLVAIAYFESDIIREKGFFAGYTLWTWAAILIQALGGIVVAIVVKYTDNIVKNFATSIAILVGCVLNVWILDFTVTSSFVFGSALVMLAAYLYNTF